jgi:hypothetical protein
MFFFEKYVVLVCFVRLRGSGTLQLLRHKRGRLRQWGEKSKEKIIEDLKEDYNEVVPPTGASVF